MSIKPVINLLLFTSVLAFASSATTAATITVDTLADLIADNDECSLREALENANENNAAHDDCSAGSGADLVTFDIGLFVVPPGRSIGLASIELDGTLYAGKFGELPEGLEIRPPADSRLTLRASTLSPHRVLQVRNSAAPFVLSDIDIVGGGGSGSGVGVLLESQDAHFQRIGFIDNQANSGYGGAALSQNGGNGLLRISECLFSGNRALNGHGGAISLYNIKAAHQVLIEDTDFINNQSAGDGGAIRFEASSSLGGPGTPLLDIVRGRFIDGAARHGAGISAWAGSDADQRLRENVSDSLFQGNQASSWGGGVRVDGFYQGSQSSLQVRRSSFVDNSAPRGGGIAAQNLDAHIENSLFAENSADIQSGGLYFRAENTPLPRALALVGNSFHRQTQSGFNSGRSLYLWVPEDASGWEWTIAGNLFDPAIDPPAVSECMIDGGSTQPLTLQGGANLSPDADCLFLGPADIQGAPLVTATSSSNLLKPLDLLPQSGSPAIDAWPAADCLDVDGAPLTDDLREASRPSDGDASGTADCDIGAFELPDAYLLDVSLSGNGDGQVSSNPAGIDCGAQCQNAFADGASVTLSASASPGSVFTGWSGDCSGSANCVLLIDAAKSVTASFEQLPSHPLSVTLSGDGGGVVESLPSGIQCQPNCEASFAEGSLVTLSATADAGSTFAGWSGGGCSGTADCQVTISAATAVTADFAATHFPVSVTLPGGGVGSVTSDLPGIDCPALDCSASFPRSEQLTLSASANAGSVFVGWEDDCLAFGDADCVLDMDNGPYTAGARFERERTLTVVTSGSGSGQVVSNPAGIDCPGQCSATWVDGSMVTLSASADPGSVFVGWNSSQCSGNGNCELLLDADVSVGAVFQTGSHPLSVSVIGGGSVTSSPAGIACPGDCEESYLSGASITLTASAQPGYAFDHWSGDCSGSGACVVPMDQARSVTAHFVENATDIFANGFE